MSLIHDIWVLLCTLHYTFGKTTTQNIYDVFLIVNAFVHEHLESFKRDSDPFLKELYTWFESYDFDRNNDNLYIF